MIYEGSKNDRTGYNLLYRGKISGLAKAESVDEYIEKFERGQISPFYDGGPTKGYVRQLALNTLNKKVRELELLPNKVTILDAGCGMGELSVYLACKHYNVVGVDISEEACIAAKKLAEKLGVSERCEFIPGSLEVVPIADKSIDFVIGLASLHHFIKYEAIPLEFARIMKPSAHGLFADSFGENPAYHLFHNKERMARLGDITLTKPLIEGYFDQFYVELIPTDWFVMLDKLAIKLCPKSLIAWYRCLSRANFWLDRKIPYSNRLALYLSGSVFTRIKLKV